MSAIVIKTPEQIEGIRKSAKLAAETLKYLEQFVVPGMKTIDIDKKCEEFIRDHGAIPATKGYRGLDRKSTRLNSSHIPLSRMPSSA